MTVAENLRDYTRGLIAWNMPDRFKRDLVRTTRNQYGTTYRFIDGSRAFVPKGRAQAYA